MERRELFIFFFALLFTQTHSMAPEDAAPFLQWANSQIMDTNWNRTLNPCSWNGINCVNDNLRYIDLSPGVVNSVIWGGLPDMPAWAQLKRTGQAFSQLVLVRFTNYRFGPYLPGWAEQYWTKGSDPYDVSNNPGGINFEVQTTTSLLCPLPDEFNLTLARPRNVSCTNLNIIEMTPEHGPKEGNTTVYIKLNTAMSYLDMTCSFGSEDGQSFPVPVKRLYFSDYPWEDYANASNGNLPYSISFVTCVSPPHAPGRVNFTLRAGGSLLNKGFPSYFYYECPAGTYGPPSSPICSDCPPGYWSPSASQTCYPCPAGTFSDIPGTSICSKCPEGTESSAKAANSSSTCTPCQPGTYARNNGTAVCSSCSPGYFQPDTGSSSCLNCTGGTFSNATGAKTCEKCPPGKYSTPTSNGCLNCPFAEYTTREGSSFCSKCQPGTTTSDVGLTECDVVCSAGYYRPAELSRCIECPPGKFSNSSGLAICSLCPLNSYNPFYNSTECYPCSNNTITYSQGAIRCSPLPEAPPVAENPGFIIGIICMILALLIAAFIIVYIIYKKKQHDKKQHEIDEIRKIMDGQN